jgi:pre-mRNA-splicing factor ISY1
LQLKEKLKDEGKLREERRPWDVNKEHDSRRAEKWRTHVIKEIAKKVTQIQNAGLGEFKIRDLNDEINKLLREKVQWEDRIIQLGGPDYKVTNFKPFFR